MAARALEGIWSRIKAVSFYPALSFVGECGAAIAACGEEGRWELGLMKIYGCLQAVINKTGLR